MRLLVVSNLYPPVARGGYEVECSAVVDHLRSVHDVTVLTSDLDAAELEADPHVVRSLPFVENDSGGTLLAPRAAFVGAQLTRRVLERVRPDLVWVWNGTFIPQSAIRVIADHGVPLAFRVCEHWFGNLFRTDRFMLRLVSRPNLWSVPWNGVVRSVNRLPQLRLDPDRRFSAAVSWNSEAVRRLSPAPHVARVVHEDIVHSVPRHIDTFFSLRRNPDTRPLVTCVGRVTPYKGTTTAIRAVASLVREHQVDARLAIAGHEDAEYGRELRTLVRELGLADVVEFLGPVPPEEVSALFSRSAAVVVPSVWQEPFPLVTIEAAAARVPIVASDVGGISEGMRDEEHALLFPAGDAQRCAHQLLRALRDVDQTEGRVARAHERANAFRLKPYLRAQEAFVERALAAFASPDAGASDGRPSAYSR